MSDLADFLLARIAEDEGDAHHVSRFSTFVADDGYVAGQHTSEEARVLAECEAKRRIVKRYIEAEACALADDHDPDSHAECAWRGQGLFEALHDLALPHADHPDYREEWRP